MSRNDSEWFNKINWSELTNEHVNYALDQANRSLQTSLDSCQELDKKSFVLFIITVGYISALFPFIIKSNDPIFFVPCSIVIIGFLVAVSMLVHSIKTRQYFPMGNYPKNTLWPPESLKGDYKNFLQWEIVSRQDWIASNEKENTKKGKLINLSLFIIVFSIIIAFITYLFLKNCL